MNELELDYDSLTETALDRDTEVSDLGDAVSETKCWHWWPVITDSCWEDGRN